MDYNRHNYTNAWAIYYGNYWKNKFNRYFNKPLYKNRNLCIILILNFEFLKCQANPNKSFLRSKVRASWATQASWTCFVLFSCSGWTWAEALCGFWVLRSRTTWVTQVLETCFVLFSCSGWTWAEILFWFWVLRSIENVNVKRTNRANLVF